MYTNVIKIAWRNMVRNKAFSAINVMGLALGMAASLFIFLWVQDELSIGKQYKNSPFLYRIMEREFSSGKVVADEDTPGLLAEELKKQFPEVQYAAGISWPEGHVLTVGDKMIRQNGCYAGADWFAMYSIPLLAGTPATALNAPSGIVISRKLAQAYFDGDPRNAIGKTIRFDNTIDYEVTAVFEDLPANEPEQYDYLLSWASFLERNTWLRDWTNCGPGTRIQLKPTADPQQFNAKLEWFLKGRNTDFNSTYYIQLFLQPETEAYLHASFKNGYREGGRIVYVRLLAIVAVFLLLIAGINFTNLATARSVKRAREVGVRKTIGAGRLSLIRQFMGEAMLLTMIALVLAIVTVMTLLPAFNHLTGKQLALSLSRPAVWGGLLGLLMVTSFLAGSYPAFFLSSLKPVLVLKGVLRFGTGTQFFRRGLVVFQFVMSMLLITGTLIVYRQLHYIQTKDIGYDRKDLVSIPGRGMAKKYDAFKNELLQLGGIEAVTHAALNPLNNGNTTEAVSWPGKDPNDMISFNQTAVWYDFAKVLKVRIVQGRDFSPGFADSNNYLINQMAANRMGYKDPVGQPLTFWRKPGKIIGVIEDFHFNSLHQPITPMIIRLEPTYSFDNILIRTKPGKTKEAIAGIEKLYTRMNPDQPFAYSFVDEGYQRQYKSEAIVSTLATIFTLLAIIIACLGLFGLAAFTAEQRTKEIGVRKVLGASVANIVGLLSKDFLKLVLIAIVIASPVAWWVMHQWLQGYAYRVTISWWIFVLAGVLAVLIALVTVSFQSIKAALMSPAKSLKTE